MNTCVTVENHKEMVFWQINSAVISNSDTCSRCPFGSLQEEKQKAYKREKRKERKRKAGDADLDGQDMDPDMASLMGFSGFGTSKK